MLTQFLASRREAASRSYEHRKDAYVNFITKFYECWGTIEEEKFLGWPQGDPPEEYFQPLYDLLMPVRIFGTTRAANLARRALHSLATGIEWDKIEGMVDDLMHQIRRDLSIPGYWRKVKPEPLPEMPSIPPPPPLPPPSVKHA